MTLWMFALACRSTVAPPPAATAAEPTSVEGSPDESHLWAEQGLARHMQEHFSAATDGVWYLANGRLQTMRTRVAQLVHAPHEDLPEPLSPFATELSEVAGRWAASSDPGAAARLSAEVATRCAACHQASGALPPLDEDDIELVNLDARGKHSLAPYYLWVGLILPSDLAWTSGAAHLGVDDELALGTVGGEAYAALGQRARDAATDERAEVWGQVLASCAGCHESVRVEE